MAKRNPKQAHLVEPTWGQSEGDGPPVTELISEMAGRAVAVRRGPQLPAAAGAAALRPPDRQAQPGRPAGRGVAAQEALSAAAGQPAFALGAGASRTSSFDSVDPTTTQTSAAIAALIVSRDLRVRRA